MDYTVISRQILRAIRGDRSQNFVNKRMKYSFNQVSKWESGYKKILWVEFVQLCQVCKISLNDSLKKVLNFSDDPELYNKLVKRLIGDTVLSEVADQIGLSRFTVGRWINKQTSPSLVEVLKLIDIYKGLVVEFVSSFVEIKKVETLYEEHLIRKQQKQIHYKYPEISCLLRLLELSEYVNSEHPPKGFISERFKISKQLEETIFSEMIQSDMVKEVDGKFKVTMRRLDTMGDFKGVLALKKYWTKYALEVLDVLTPETKDAVFGYRVFSVSDGAKKKVQEKLYEFYDNIKKIISQDNELPTNVLTLNLQLFDPSILAKN